MQLLKSYSSLFFVQLSCFIYILIAFIYIFLFCFASLIYFALFSTYLFVSNLLYFIVSNIQWLVISFSDICDTLEWYLQEICALKQFLQFAILCKTIVLYKFQLSNTIFFVSDKLLYVRTKNRQKQLFFVFEI